MIDIWSFPINKYFGLSLPGVAAAVGVKGGGGRV